MIFSARAALAGAVSRGIGEWLPTKAAGSNQFRRAEILGRLETRCAIPVFQVFKDLALEIADEDAVGIAAQHVLRVDGHLAAATGRVDDVLRHTVAGGV